MSRGKTSIGIDIRAKSITIATLRKEGRRTTLADIQTIPTPQLLERGSYRDARHITDALNQALEAHITSNPLISVSAVRSRTLMTTVPLKGLNRKKATQVINAQANRHFPTPNEQTITVDTAHLKVKGKKGKPSIWLAGATPNEHLKVLREIEEGTNRKITRVTPKAIAALHAGYPQVTLPGDHLILSGGDDGADLTLILDGTIEVIRFLGHDLENEINPELQRTLEYLSSEGREAPTLHLAAYHQRAQHLAETLQIDVATITPWDNLNLDAELTQDPAELEQATIAIGLAMGALDVITPDLNLRTSKERAAARKANPAASGAPRANLAQLASLLLIVGAGGYHFMTSMSVNSLQQEVNTLNAQLMNRTSPEQQVIDELQSSIDELLQHEALAESLTIGRLKPTEHITWAVHGLPSTAHSGDGDGMRFQALSMRTATETPAGHQPLPNDTEPATLITITAIAPDNITLEDDLRALESNPNLRTHVRHANRAEPDDTTDTSLHTQIEILTLTHTNWDDAPTASHIIPLEMYQ